MSPEFRFETVGHLRAGFLLIIRKDLIEIFLHERVEGESAAHDGFRRTVIPLQNSDSLRAVTVPLSISESRRIASCKTSSGAVVDSTLRSSSLASLRRERCGNFIAKTWISDAVFIGISLA